MRKKCRWQGGLTPGIGGVLLGGAEMIERLFHQEVFCSNTVQQSDQTRASPWGLWTGPATCARKAILAADGHEGARAHTRKVVHCLAKLFARRSLDIPRRI